MTNSVSPETTQLDVSAATIKQKLKYKLHYLNDHLKYRQSFFSDSLVSSLLATLKLFFIPEKIILFYPELPERGMIDYRLTVLLGYAVTNNPKSSCDIIFKRKDATFFDKAELNIIDYDKSKIINGASRDISKSNVGKKFEQVFGYALDVDPIEYCGKIVDKSDQNAAHDGVVVDGPMKLEQLREGRVYQKAIDNSWNKPGFVLDHRVPIHNGKIPLVYLKYRQEQSRFSNKNDTVSLAEPEAVFSTDELAKLILLADNMGIDFGEFDVLRDQDKRIYVVDINSTPFGPPNGLSPADSDRALQLMSKSFDAMLKSRIIK